MGLLEGDRQDLAALRGRHLYLLLGAFVATRRPSRTIVLASLGAVLLTAAPFAYGPSALVRSALGFQGARGLHIESLWGSFLFLGYDPGRGLRSGAGTLEFVGTAASWLEAAAFVCLVGVVITSVRLARRTSDTTLVQVMFLTGVLLIAVAPVLSPQFIIWTLALAAAAGCVRGATVEVHCLLMLPVALLTHALFPSSTTS